MMVKTTLLMHLKCLFVALNKDHMLVLGKIITKFVRDHVEAGSTQFLGVDGEERINKTMPEKLRMWEEKAGKEGKPADSPVSQKRPPPYWESTLATMAGGGVPPQAKKAKTTTPRKAGDKAAENNAEEAQKEQTTPDEKAKATAAHALQESNPDAAQTSKGQPVNDLAALLNDWK